MRWHGHVITNRDGYKARCIGEAHCEQCKVERHVADKLLLAASAATEGEAIDHLLQIRSLLRDHRRMGEGNVGKMADPGGMDAGDPQGGG